jgi:hypothetical protein
MLMSSNRIVLYEQSDNLLEIGALEPLTDNTTGLTIDAATCTADLFDSDGSALGVQVSIAAVSAGLYRGTLANDHAAVVSGQAGESGTIEWNADDGADKHAFWETDFIVLKRRE